MPPPPKVVYKRWMWSYGRRPSHDAERNNFMFSKLFQKNQKAIEPTEVYHNLRRQILSLHPGDAGIEPTPEMPHVWGVLMETGYPEAVVTLLSLADGTTSLYFSSGGGLIGGGQHPTVAQASQSFVAAAGAYYQKMTLTWSFPLPGVGRVKFYVLTYSGIYTADADENELGHRKHELSPLFYDGQDVITQFRLAQQGKT